MESDQNDAESIILIIKKKKQIHAETELYYTDQNLNHY